MIKHSELIFGEMLSENKYIVAYHSNTDKGEDYWNPPKYSAVQIAAAITASARIYMYPLYLKRGLLLHGHRLYCAWSATT